MKDEKFGKPHHLKPLWLLQKLLIREISRAERKIRRTKYFLKNAEREKDDDGIEVLEGRIEEYRHLAYTWRCFGDAVAFLFMDKFALKHTFYNTKNISPRQDAGFMIDKSGSELEISILQSILDGGVPALLTDLTNSIRYGDVVCMIGPDPHIIEVKSGKLDSRGKRQLKYIRQLNEFYATDEIENFRGFDKVKRIISDFDEVCYVDIFNDCAVEAIKNGFSLRNPEDGLHYLAISTSEVEISKIVGGLNLTDPLVFLLNEAKSNRVWEPYNPYVLSFVNEEALWEFVWGGLVVIVIYDLDVMKRLAEQEGREIKFSSLESNYAFEIWEPGGGGSIKMGKHLFNRLAYDFSSPLWLYRFVDQRLNYHAVSDVLE